ncbi:5122_t:CDS:2 [Dentiscutata erythropus]|uniref:5122_t:CDS:1 n=1 Tax=Dentiscutata erythropus TaxID=1348616 RepID=A0A9N9EVB8_9GLOM|nr:5122_t:CDS:2 [Dentiscutata erythropus]
MSKTTHTKKETRVGDDGNVHTVTTTTVTYSGSGSGSKYFNTNINDFLADSNFGEDFGNDFFSKIKRVSYEKPHEQPPHLPKEYSLYKKPTQEVEYLKSDCSGHRRALLIGINYIGTKYKLEESDITVLTDDQHDPSRIPTRENILKQMRALVANARPHDSGHGGQQVDTDGDEEDGYDETIMPLDFQTRGQIIDDEMHHILVDGLPAGCRLTVVFDSCHSGTVLDLPYVYSTHDRIKKPHIIKHAINAGIKYIQGDREDAKLVTAQAFAEQKIRRKNLETKSSPADVIMFSGCKDEQTSADASEGGSATGAMSHALITTDQTYLSLLNNIRDILRDKYSQKPQLSASHPMDMNEVFKM